MMMVSIALWVTVGICNSAILLLQEARDSKALTIGDLWLGSWTVLLGPVGVAICLSQWLDETGISKRVVWKRQA